MAGRIVWAWILTIPDAAGVAGCGLVRALRLWGTVIGLR